MNVSPQQNFMLGSGQMKGMNQYGQSSHFRNSSMNNIKSSLYGKQGNQSSEKGSSFVRIDDIPKIGQQNSSTNNLVVSPDQAKVTGFIKFFFENENYGFLQCDQDQKDVFFHADDFLESPTFSKEWIIQQRENYAIRFAFNKLAYFGRYGLSMKAINIELIDVQPSPFQ